MRKHHIEAFFLQLIAADLIAAKKYKGILSWIVCREQINTYVFQMKYKSDSNWKGINLHPSDKKRKYKIPYYVDDN